MININPKDIINRYSEIAEIYLKDKKKLAKLIEAAKKPAGKNKTGPVDELISKIDLLRGIIADYISGNYREVPWGSVGSGYPPF